MIGVSGRGPINLSRQPRLPRGYYSPGADGAKHEPGRKPLLSGRAPHRDAGSG
jgi:hypothetical protein